jgi:NADPH:quinone reductase-like Zn-dependent oxidoreductase
MPTRVRELAPDGVDAVFDHLGGANATLSYRLLNRTGTLVSYSIAAKLNATSPILLDFLTLLSKLAYWNYLPTRRHASFYNVWAGAGKQPWRCPNPPTAQPSARSSSCPSRAEPNSGKHPTAGRGFPATATGKVRRVDLRAMAAATLSNAAPGGQAPPAETVAPHA